MFGRLLMKVQHKISDRLESLSQIMVVDLFLCLSLKCLESGAIELFARILKQLQPKVTGQLTEAILLVINCMY